MAHRPIGIPHPAAAKVQAFHPATPRKTVEAAAAGAGLTPDQVKNVGAAHVAHGPHVAGHAMNAMLAAKHDAATAGKKKGF